MLSSARYNTVMLVSLALLACCAVAPRAHAQVEADTPPPSVFGYGYRGLFVGALAGLGAGYLAVRSDGVEGEEWKGLVLGAGIGALTLASASVALGLVDQHSPGPWITDYVLRDALYGVTFGALAGAAAGGLVVLETDEGEHALFGTAVGSLIGLGVGIASGSLAGVSASERARHQRYRSREHERTRVDVTVSMAPTRRGSTVGASIAGTF